MRAAVAAVWLYEGLWCKLLGREPRQVEVVEAVPRLGPIVGRTFLRRLGAVETLLALWVLSGVTPGLSAIAQTALLVALNANGLLWARHIIHDPGRDGGEERLVPAARVGRRGDERGVS